jgi:hypothetical protein
MFRETHKPYRPAVLGWPELEAAARARIVALPIWDIAVQTESRARLTMAAYAATLRNGGMRAALAGTFEPVMQEACRHILLFANWAGWPRARLSPWARVRFELKAGAVWAFLAWERIGLARKSGANAACTGQDNHFTVHSAQSVTDADVSLRELLALCLLENDRRFAGYDERLLRPATVPRLARLALRLLQPSGRQRR